MGTAVGLFIISAFKHNIKRCAAVLVAGLLCFSAEAFLHFQGPTIEPSMSNFSRRYLLNFAGVIITIIVVLAGVLLVYSGCFLFLALFNYRHSSEFDFEYHGQLIIRGTNDTRAIVLVSQCHGATSWSSQRIGSVPH